jgi:hypothetical protein
LLKSHNNNGVLFTYSGFDVGTLNITILLNCFIPSLSIGGMESFFINTANPGTDCASFISGFALPPEVTKWKVLSNQVKLHIKPVMATAQIWRYKNSSKCWVSIFSPYSYFEGSWNKVEKIVFRSLNENGALQGLI